MSFPLLFGAAKIVSQFWYCVPVGFAICLVEACTRFEDVNSILHRFVKWLLWGAGFVVVMFTFLFWLTKGL